MIDQAVVELTPHVGVREACKVLGEPRARWYRSHRQSPPPPRPERVRAPQPRALDEVQRKEVLRVLHSDEHVDEAPVTVYAKLLDEGTYLASTSTMYRILRDADEVRERRRQATHPPAKKPELVATRPNEVYSWDITKLLGPAKRTYYYLYVIIDIYSRYVPGWMLARAERAHLAERLLADTIAKQDVARHELTVHADRGASMASKPVAFLLADLGVTKSHSRPHCSNDNPFSEAQFKTLKYRPAFPVRFGSIQDARAHCHVFFPWYNAEHHHSSLGLLTPHDVHYGFAEQRVAARAVVLATAHAAHPERFPRGLPQPPACPTEVWINPPKPRATGNASYTTSHEPAVAFQRCLNSTPDRRSLTPRESPAKLGPLVPRRKPARLPQSVRPPAMKCPRYVTERSPQGGIP